MKTICDNDIWVASFSWNGGRHETWGDKSHCEDWLAKWFAYLSNRASPASIVVLNPLAHVNPDKCFGKTCFYDGFNDIVQGLPEL